MNQYYFEDFTEENYKRLLEITKKKWEFFSYDERYEEKKFVLWRHDVDFSMHRAYKLALIESELNVKSTFFLQLNSEFYNLFEKEIKALVFKIKSLGHNLGLHFDASTYSIKNLDDFQDKLSFEKNVLDNLFDININVFSYHNPTEDILKYDNDIYCEMINTYSKFMKENIMYCSDSNGYWRHERLENFLEKNNEKIQVLTHPVWWTKSVLSPRERVSLSINGRAKKQHEFYDKLLSDNHRNNIQ